MLPNPLAGLRLLLPAIVPSWRFFDAVGDSPRIDHAVVAGPDTPVVRWHTDDPRVRHLSPARMIRRLFWNPAWNDGLYRVSLAERLLTGDDPRTVAHSEREMIRRIARGLDAAPGDWLRIRIRLVTRDSERVAYESGAVRVSDLIAP
ncbi:MAG: hypothetical protein PGN23_00580 [Sphingomonas adhaesiva]|uniref:hypothetical protein n=1 Tax=Sphingomonas adhaesiva TaxID=28212 RepID=UPI002FF79496